MVGRRLAAASAAAVAVATGAILLTDAPHDPTGEASEVRVTSVVDGDTIRAQSLTGRELGRVRLLGVDAPELAHGADPADCFAQEATARLTDLAPPRSRAYLVADPGQPGTDNYGRLLRYVEADGRDVSTELLADGAARLYDSATALLRQRELSEAAGLAQARHRGLWVSCPVGK